MRKLLFPFLFGIIIPTLEAAPLLISGTGGLQPEVSYYPAEGDTFLEFRETFPGIPASLNTEGVTDYIQLTLSAPTGYQFTFAANTNISIDFFYVDGTEANIGFTKSASLQISYAGLVGNAPTWEDYSSALAKEFSFSLYTSFDEEFSFTSITLTMPISGTGLNSVVSDNGEHRISATQSPYLGEAPPNEDILLAVTAVPEPSSVLIGIVGLGGLLAWTRRRQA